MSRTDHHRPWQIRAADRTDVKGNDPAYFRHADWSHQDGYCTEHCGWTLPHHVIAAGPPRWYRRHRWYGAERNRERTQFGLMAKEYRVNCEDGDYDFPNHNHRHNAAWSWW